MAVELFGFTIGRTQKEKEQQNRVSFTLPQSEDGAIDVAGTPGGAYATYLDMEGSAKNEADLILRYRSMALFPEAEIAIDDIVNDAVVADREQPPVSLNLTNVNISPDIKTKIGENFGEILGLLKFNDTAFDTFRKWYVDGRLYYHIIIDQDNPKKGILELRPIDALKIRKVRQVLPAKDQSEPSLMPRVEEYFAFNEHGMDGKQGGQVMRIAADSIAYCHSGLLNEDKKMVLSYLHKAIKPLNQLRMIEDSVVIYRISRAPERRIFYIDVGNLPKIKAEQYLRDVMMRYRNKLVYDANTGEIRDDKKFMSMMEDFWLPRREGGRGTEITTLPGGQNLGEITDINYFQKKLYRALNVPETRLQSEGGFSLGRSSEILRDEIKFSKFVGRLRKRFSSMFSDMLKTQLILKNIVTPEDWDAMSDHIQYDFLYDNHFAELKEAELLTERLTLTQTAEPYVGKYYSQDYVRRHILRQTDAEIIEQDEQIKKEIKDGTIPDPSQMQIDPMTGQPMTGPIDQPPQMPSSPKSPDASGDEIETPSGGEI